MTVRRITPRLPAAVAAVAVIGLTATGCSVPRDGASRPPDPARQAWLDSLQMISATTGWSLLWTANPASDRPAYLEPARTTDGGRTWTAVAPPALGATPAGLALLHAQSTDRAWVAVVAASGPARENTEVYRTADGGRTWRRSQPIPGADPVAIDFAGAAEGWLLESDGAAMQQNPVRLYRTSDGGLRWALAASTAASGQAPPGASGLPVYCDKAGLAFRSPQDGWITGDCNILADSVLVSRDGGARWAPQRLPVPAATCQPTGCAVATAEFAGSTTFLQIDAYPAAAYLLVSDNSGRNWRVRRLPAGAGPYPAVRFFSALDGIAVSAGPQGTIGRDFYRTSDGGLSWTPVPQGRHFSRPGTSFDFTGTGTGFGWVPGADAGGSTPVMYRTSDSGRSWTTFTPHKA